MSLPELKQLGPQVWTCPQIQAQDIDEIVAKGFHTIINNRPDHEEPAQPLSDTLRDAALKAGLVYEFLPVVGGKITPEQVDAFAHHLQELPKPILTFCRTGNRCSILWSLVQQKGAV